jgi:formate hydrogenlyase subunit 6/NADH:ubiquinone oxidoreductase subunit I
MATPTRQEVGPGAATPPNGRRTGLPGLGLIKGLIVTLKHMLQPSITQQYPDEKPDLPARTRGVIALKQENCTVCWKCSRECPDWCIYIESHKETHPPAAGGRARSVKVLDRFAIDYALCMYCGICVEVCPFDALFWSPEFEYAEYDIFGLTHEKERLEEWTYQVMPPPELEVGAEPPEAEAEAAPTEAAPTEAGGGLDAGAGGAPEAPTEAAAPAPQPPAATGTQAAPAAAQAPPAAAQAAPAAAQAAPAAAAPPAARPAAEREHVEPDQETYDRVLAEELAKGTDRRVAEGRAKAAAIRTARAKAG